MFSLLSSDDEPIPISPFASSPTFDLFDDLSWKHPDKHDTSNLHRSKSKSIPLISQPLFNQKVPRFKHPTKKNKFINHFTVGQNTRPIYLPKETADDERFIQICNDKTHMINPHKIGFIPSNFWLDEYYEFGDIVRDFFHRKNHPSCRFSHKLFNALKLTESDKSYFEFTGVEWKSQKVLHVNKISFARLLGMKSIDGSLFHQQGNFPAFGFIELPLQEIQNLLGIEAIQNINIDIDRYLIHNPGVFISDCSEQDITDEIKWIGVKKRNAV